MAMHMFQTLIDILKKNPKKIKKTLCWDKRKNISKILHRRNG